MKLSICCITYKHEKFIAQAIDSFIMQQTNFDFEIIIADDNSPDSTAAICKQYQAKYPGKIKLLLNNKNIGMMPNFSQALNACAGEYIALCEGDDYWTDTQKLQKQVDFLEANQGYTICFHRVQELKDGGQFQLQADMPDTEKQYTINQLAAGNFMHTPSVVFKNNIQQGLPSWFNQSPVGDYPLHLINASKGLIWYLPGPMAVYRRHDGGIWSNIQSLQRSEKWLRVLHYLLQENFTAEIKNILLQQVVKYQEKHLKALMRQDDWKAFLEKLSEYSLQSSYISQKWLMEYYPAYITSLKASRPYRFSKKLAKIFKGK